MFRRILLPFMLLMATHSNAQAPNIPEDLVPYAKGMFILGQPKSMKITLRGEDGIYDEEYRKYSEDGIATEVIPRHGRSIHVIKNGKRVHKIDINLGEVVEKSNLTEIVVEKYDEEGRPIVLISRSNTGNNIFFTPDNMFRVYLIEYGADWQIQSEYRVENGRRGVPVRRRYEYSQDGSLKRRCVVASSEECGINVLGEYSSVGPTLTHDSVEKHYTYIDGLLESVEAARNPKMFERERYSNYKVDACGNWVYRELERFLPNEEVPNKLSESRDIAYYKDCQ